MSRGRIEFEESSGNVFQDLGQENPEEALAKARLARQIAKIVEQHGWTQTEAGEQMGIDQPKVSKILRGQLREFSLERLLGFVRALGWDVEIVLRQGTTSPAGLRVVEEYTVGA